MEQQLAALSKKFADLKKLHEDYKTTRYQKIFELSKKLRLERDDYRSQVNALTEKVAAAGDGTSSDKYKEQLAANQQLSEDVTALRADHIAVRLGLDT